MQIQRKNGRAGFTLAELMVVIVIIGLLATLVVPNVMKKLFTANKVKAKADIVGIEKAVNDYAIDNNGRFPDSIEALVVPGDDGQAYLSQETIPKDPWGNEYFYEPPPSGTTKFRVVSYGKDGQPGGEGDDADLDNIKIRNQEI